MNVQDLVVLTLSSGVVATIISNLWQYWTTQRSASKEREYNHIYETFILNGLYQVEEAISEYGNSVTLAFSDLAPELKR
jgi:hypothetical protein